MIRAQSFSVTTMGFADTLLPEFRSGVIGAPNGQIASWMNITERDGTLVVRDRQGASGSSAPCKRRLASAGTNEATGATERLQQAVHR